MKITGSALTSVTKRMTLKKKDKKQKQRTRYPIRNGCCSETMEIFEQKKTNKTKQKNKNETLSETIKRGLIKESMFVRS